MAAELGRPLRVIDVGGRHDYWDNVGFDGLGSVLLVNILPGELGRHTDRPELFTDHLGDARNLAEFADGEFDLYHSNSVIEHVGGWGDMAAMAREARRVGRHGWVQTPAWGFPIEPHYKLPFMHWFGRPAQTAMLRFAPGLPGKSWSERRGFAEEINLLGAKDLRVLFPGCEIERERVLVTKSFVVTW